MAAPNVSTDHGLLAANPTAATSQTTAAIGTSTDGVHSLIVNVACRVSALPTTLTLTDSAGSSYAIPTGAAFLGAGQCVVIFLCANPAGALVAGTSTFTLAATGGATVAAYTLRAFELDSVAADVGVGAHANASSNSPAVTSGAPASGDYLWVGVHGATLGTGTDTISSTGYTLSPLTTGLDTSGGASNLEEMKSGYKQVTASAVSQTFNGAWNSSRAWAAAVVAVKQIAAASLLPAQARGRHLGARSPSPARGRF